MRIVALEYATTIDPGNYDEKWYESHAGNARSIYRFYNGNRKMNGLRYFLAVISRNWNRSGI